jgi:hypothetical protein
MLQWVHYFLYRRFVFYIAAVFSANYQISEQLGIEIGSRTVHSIASQDFFVIDDIKFIKNLYIISSYFFDIENIVLNTANKVFR